jgi:SAM-dependent methyltransferase
MYYQIFYRIYKKASEEMYLKIKEFIKEKEKILDLGCGSGIFARTLSEKLNIEILGLDIKDRRICQIPFQLYDGEKIPFPNDFFNVVLISFVLHHTKDPVSILKEAKRVGKKLIIFEDLPEGFFGKIYCFLHWIFWNLFFGNFSKFNFYTTEKWKEIFKNLGLKLISEKNFLVKRKIFILEK